MTTAIAPTIWPIALIASQFTAWSNYDCTREGFLDDIMAVTFAVWQSKTILARSCEAGGAGFRRRAVNASHSADCRPLYPRIGDLILNPILTLINWVEGRFDFTSVLPM